MKKMFENKKILITQHALRSYTGSEIVTLELALFFKEQGADVIIYTWVTEDPLKSIANKFGIYVTINEKDEKLTGFDYVWVHHQVMPIKLLYGLKQKNKKPIFIFFHMSSSLTSYLEQPFISDLEKKISSKSLFVSQESFDVFTSQYSWLHSLDTGIFPNPSPEIFLSNFKKRQPKLRNIAVISNHPQPELFELQKSFLNDAINMDFIGHSQNRFILVSPDIIQKYDLIITIGKTVQYCLVSGTPVYIYDHFGGCGYLNINNFNKASYYNFSGRGFYKKTASKLKKEILSGYKNAFRYQQDNLKFFQEKYLLLNNVKAVFENITPIDNIELTDDYINNVELNENFVKNHILQETEFLQIRKENVKLKKEIKEVREELAIVKNSKVIKLLNKLHNHFK